METIRGKSRVEMNLDELQRRLAGRQRVALDLGTGDGRYVCDLAARHPDWLVIGLDACRENLRGPSRTGLPNAMFVIASAQELPRELRGLVSRLTINFPWGSLLRSLLEDDPALMAGLNAVACPAANLELRLNGGALAEAGHTLEEGTARIADSLLGCGWRIDQSSEMDAAALRPFPSTWARRLAHGRDPCSILLCGSLR